MIGWSIASRTAPQQSQAHEDNMWDKNTHVFDSLGPKRQTMLALKTRTSEDSETLLRRQQLDGSGLGCVALLRILRVIHSHTTP